MWADWLDRWQCDVVFPASEPWLPRDLLWVLGLVHELLDETVRLCSMFLPLPLARIREHEIEQLQASVLERTILAARRAANVVG